MDHILYKEGNHVWVRDFKGGRRLALILRIIHPGPSGWVPRYYVKYLDKKSPIICDEVGPHSVDALHPLEQLAMET